MVSDVKRETRGLLGEVKKEDPPCFSTLNSPREQKMDG